MSAILICWRIRFRGIKASILDLVVEVYLCLYELYRCTRHGQTCPWYHKILLERYLMLQRDLVCMDAWSDRSKLKDFIAVCGYPSWIAGTLSPIMPDKRRLTTDLSYASSLCRPLTTNKIPGFCIFYWHAVGKFCFTSDSWKADRKNFYKGGFWFHILVDWLEGDK